MPPRCGPISQSASRTGSSAATAWWSAPTAASSWRTSTRASTRSREAAGPTPTPGGCKRDGPVPVLFSVDFPPEVRQDTSVEWRMSAWTTSSEEPDGSSPRSSNVTRWNWSGPRAADRRDRPRAGHLRLDPGQLGQAGPHRPWRAPGADQRRTRPAARAGGRQCSASDGA